MKLLILGSTGAFGTALEAVCLSRCIDVVPLSHQDVDITDKDALKRVLKKHQPQVVVNSVAMVGINPCEEEPQKAFAVNATAVSCLAKICQAEEILLVQPSTHAVFDGNSIKAYSEEDLPRPASVYSASKYMGECLAVLLCKKHYVIRFPTLFGPRRNDSLGFVDKVLRWIGERDEIKIAKDKIDSPSYTLDLANALLDLIEQEKPYGTYHLANSGQASYYDFVCKIVAILGTSTKVIPVQDRDFEALAYKPLRTAIVSCKLPPLRGWEEALRDYLASRGNT